MTVLLLLLAAAPWGVDDSGADLSTGRRAACWVVPVREAGAALRGVPFYPATRTLSIRFRAHVRRRPRAPSPPALRLHVHAPNGHLYDVLEASPFRGRWWRPFLRAEARLPVAGSSILNSSLYGRWTVVPYLEGDERPCGRARPFAIEPRDSMVGRRQGR